MKPLNNSIVTKIANREHFNIRMGVNSNTRNRIDWRLAIKLNVRTAINVQRITRDFL